MLYDVNGNSLESVYAKNESVASPVYDVNGNQITNANHYVSNRYTRTLLYTLSDLPTGTQGIAVDNLSSMIAQLYSGNLYTIDLADGSFVKRNTINNIDLGHGSAGQFAPEKAQASDMFPLLYVSHGSNTTIDGQVYGQLLEIVVQESTCTISRVFLIPINNGTYGQTAIDFDNGIIYHVTRIKYEPESGETIDYTYVFAYDMTQYELLSGNKYVYTELLDSFTVPFISEMQSVTFFDGLIACLSDSGNKVVFIDPEEKNVYLTITQEIPTSEKEGVGYLTNQQTGNMDMILTCRSSGTQIYKYVFG